MPLPQMLGPESPIWGGTSIPQMRVGYQVETGGISRLDACTGARGLVSDFGAMKRLRELGPRPLGWSSI